MVIVVNLINSQRCFLSGSNGKKYQPFEAGILTVASDTHKVDWQRSMSSSISVQALAHMALYVLMKAQWHHHLFLDLVISNTSSWENDMSPRVAACGYFFFN